MRKIRWCLFQPFSLLLILAGMFWATTFPVSADTSCGTGWTCVGSNTYLEVVNCTTRFGDYCANLELRTSSITCPTGGGAGSCVNNNAPGLNGCHKVGEAEYQDCICADYITQCPTKIHNSACPNSVSYECSESHRLCTAAEEGQPCSGTSAPYTDICTAVSTSQLCTCKTLDPICEPQAGSIGCCLNSCNASCAGKCGQINGCGDLCPPCGTQVCGDGQCTGTETCNTCAADCGACCGNSVCNTAYGESCATCAIDCGSCASPPPSPPPSPTPPVTCGNGTCGTGENCNNCPADCGACCGNGVCNSGLGENCSTCPTDCACVCGDGLCIAPSENRCTCTSDCGGSCGNGVCDCAETMVSCPLDCDSCGNGVCDGFETCTSCSGDCGACPTDVAWWQAAGGHVYAGGQSGYVLYSDIPADTICITPACIASLIMAGIPGDTNTAGIPMTGGGGIEANGYLTQRPGNSYAVGTTSQVKENYAYFYKVYGMSVYSTPFSSDPDDAEKPPALGEDDAPYLREGDLVIDTYAWQVSSGETIVVFVTGDLVLSDSGHLRQLIQVEQGGFLAFIVQGDVVVEASVGNDNLDDTTSNIEGVFIADGQIIIQSRGEAAGGDDRFVGAGTFVGWGGVELQRDFSDGDTRKQENRVQPAELFVYRPDFVVNTPARMKRAHYIWQETN